MPQTNISKTTLPQKDFSKPILPISKFQMKHTKNGYTSKPKSCVWMSVCKPTLTFSDCHHSHMRWEKQPNNNNNTITTFLHIFIYTHIHSYSYYTITAQEMLKCNTSDLSLSPKITHIHTHTTHACNVECRRVFSSFTSLCKSCVLTLRSWLLRETSSVLVRKTNNIEVRLGAESFLIRFCILSNMEKMRKWSQKLLW